jgi:hypothetical protein
VSLSCPPSTGAIATKGRTGQESRAGEEQAGTTRPDLERRTGQADGMLALMRVQLLASIVLGSLLLSSAALADVVEPAPTDCPAGSIGSVSHYGPYCAPNDCSGTAATCESGTACTSQPLCIEILWDSGVATSPAGKRVLGSCTPGGTCLMGTCGTWSVCMPSAGAGGASAVGGSSSKAGASGRGGSSAASGESSTSNGGEDTGSDSSGCSCRVHPAGSFGAGAALVLGFLAFSLRHTRRANRR